jgi:hypothetical protein
LVPDVFYASGDSLPIIPFTFEDEDGTAVNLTGATLALYMEDIDGDAVTLNGTLAAVDAVAGTAAYTPHANDFPTKGDYFFRARATISGKRFSAPNDRMGYLVVG